MPNKKWLASQLAVVADLRLPAGEFVDPIRTPTQTRTLPGETVRAQPSTLIALRRSPTASGEQLILGSRSGIDL
jgi:hypothetical protein